jgi:uncharacterized protein (DUF952 family)
MEDEDASASLDMEAVKRRLAKEDDGVAEHLRKLHNGTPTATANTPAQATVAEEKIYHMCQKSLWEEAVSAGKAYYPPTFEQDGFFTHATGVPERLLDLANHFYKTVPGEWICVELSCSALKGKAGIVTKFEEAKPVGSTQPPSVTWIYPHIFGGIPSHVEGVVTNTFHMKRDENGNYLSIVGLTDKQNENSS